MRIKPLLPPALVVLAVAALAGYAASTSIREDQPVLEEQALLEVDGVVQEVDAELERLWGEHALLPASRADDLTLLRRLSLSLHGTLPSLEELRRFERDQGPHRLERWTSAMLDDPRFAHYFAERLARAFVGVEAGQFIIFRRDRFKVWLSDQLRARRPYDEIVHDMISAHGIWTGEGEVNFVTAGFANDEFDYNKLTGRTVRAFLGQRIDCAQCHDHPFDDWTQLQFEGLAAHFGQVGLTLVGVHDQQSYLFDLPETVRDALARGEVTDELRRAFKDNKHQLRQYAAIDSDPTGDVWLIRDSHNSPEVAPEEIDPTDASPPQDVDGTHRYVVRWKDDRLQVGSVAGEYLVEDRDTLEKRLVEPDVPFHSEWLGTEGTRRDRLADWVTHPENRRFERAIANRVWALLFGRPFAADRPVDDLPDPDDESSSDQYRVLDILGADFRQHGCDLHRLIEVITATRAFRLESLPAGDVEDPQSLEDHWAVFPLTRLRPEQVIGSMLQASSVKTIDQNSHLFTRALRFFREKDFINEYGDLGDDELTDRSGTIPQALLRMNGEFSREMSESNPFSAAGRIAAFSSTPQKLIENCFLVCLTRRPTPEEIDHLLPQFSTDSANDEGAVQDLIWTLYNSPEFSWNH